MTREESNRKIAEALGWKRTFYLNRFHKPECAEPVRDGSCCNWAELPDFFTSEEANALVLEKARFAVIPIGEGKDGDGSYWLVGHEWMNGTVRMFATGSRKHPDRKTAICEAFLAMLEEKK